MPDTDRRGHGIPGAVVYDDRLGPLVRHDRELPNVGYDLWQVINREAEEQEMVRLFYVACTRAADHLILSSSVADIARPKGIWLKLLAERFDLTTGNLTVALPEGLFPSGGWRFARRAVGVVRTHRRRARPRLGKTPRPRHGRQ